MLTACFYTIPLSICYPSYSTQDYEALLLSDTIDVVGFPTCGTYKEVQTHLEVHLLGFKQ